MRFNNVHVSAVGHVLPERVVSSLEIEDRLAPAYDRLGFHPGRIELMSGIRERRHFEPGTRPSAVATQAAEIALERSGFDRNELGMLIFSSVCRDFMEPATASVVHANLKLPNSCQCFDMSNACLGFANAMMVAGNMIELGQIESALIVAGAGAGNFIYGALTKDHARERDGMRTVYTGLILFAVFGVFFEFLIFDGFGGLGRWLIPLVLIGAGVYMLFLRDPQSPLPWVTPGGSAPDTPRDYAGSSGPQTNATSPGSPAAPGATTTTTHTPATAPPSDVVTPVEPALPDTTSDTRVDPTAPGNGDPEDRG